ncbi:MAG: YbhB/YbcL family Raf kinase inhibitor-like protein [Candidatus Omnitrophica bacterium]|nr:YbhB/YbcL family Raf kinase inhibitor-like protein [Candidatus Omnitrophota bacterium]
MIINFLFLFVFLCCPLARAQEVHLSLTSPAFENNQVIPSQYTCTGSDINPPLTIKNVPPKTESLALTISDPDAPQGTWIHWVVYNMKPNTEMMAENSISGDELFNDFGKQHYGGPCPPGGRPHHYVFELYALDQKLSLKQDGTIKDLQQSMEGHILAKAKLTGTYSKPSW